MLFYHMLMRSVEFGMIGLDTSTTYIFKHLAKKTWLKDFQASNFPKALAKGALLGSMQSASMRRGRQEELINHLVWSIQI
jgi:hypothetical protein